MARPQPKGFIKVVNVLHRNAFTLTKGRLGGRVQGMEAVILTTTGRKSGEKRQSMLTAPIVDGDEVVLVASWNGGANDPQWFRNLEADPNVQITRKGETKNMVARVVSSAERAELWPRIVDAYKGYATYQSSTDREIPVVVFTPA